MSEPVTTGKRSVQMDLDPSPIAQSPPTVMVAGAAGGSNFEAGSSPLLGYAGVDLFQVGQVGQEGAKLIDEELRAKQQERREESDRLSDEERELQVLKPTVEGMKQQLGDYSASSDKITSELRDLEGEMKSKRIEQARLEGGAGAGGVEVGDDFVLFLGRPPPVPVLGQRLHVRSLAVDPRLCVGIAVQVDDAHVGASGLQA